MKKDQHSKKQEWACSTDRPSRSGAYDAFLKPSLVNGQHVTYRGPISMSASPKKSSPQ